MAGSPRGSATGNAVFRLPALIFYLGRRRLESDPQTPCCYVCCEHAVLDIRQNKSVHDASSRFEQLLSGRIEEFLLVNCLPGDVEPSTPRKFCENRENRSSIAFKKWVRVS